VFAENGMTVLPAPNPQNMHSIRWEAVNGVLMRRSQTGRPSSLLVDPGCVTLITGMSGGYFMRRLRVSGERYADEPEKNQYSHVCEAFENQLLGGGEGRAVTMGNAPAKSAHVDAAPQDDAPGGGVMRGGRGAQSHRARALDGGLSPRGGKLDFLR
jgi:hypothetical protein